MTLIDQENFLITKAQNGDIDAFEKLAEIYQQKIFNLALYKTQNNYLAEEITQEVLIRIYKKIRTFKFNSSFSTWIFRIVYNILSDVCKKYKNISDKELNISHDILIEGVHSEVEKENNTELIQKTLKYAISKIPHKFQFVLILYDIDGKSYDEIAQIINKNIGTVKSRLHRARKMLKEIILKDHPDIIS